MTEEHEREVLVEPGTEKPESILVADGEGGIGVTVNGVRRERAGALAVVADAAGNTYVLGTGNAKDLIESLVTAAMNNPTIAGIVVMAGRIVMTQTELAQLPAAPPAAMN